MASVNKVILIGNLGRDPEVATLPSQKLKATLSIATSYTTRDNQGGKQEHTDWHRVVLFDGLAKIASEYLKKGRPVYIEGRLKTRSWTDDKGATQWITEVVGESLQLLGTAGTPPAQGQNSPAQSASAASAPTVMHRAAPAAAPEMDEEIPF